MRTNLKQREIDLLMRVSMVKMNHITEQYVRNDVGVLRKIIMRRFLMQSLHEIRLVCLRQIQSLVCLV